MTYDKQQETWRELRARCFPELTVSQLKNQHHLERQKLEDLAQPKSVSTIAGNVNESAKEKKEFPKTEESNWDLGSFLM